MRTGTPFLGVLCNRRYLGNGSWETFENMLHLVVVFAGVRSYILGIQVDVTGLHLDLTDGSQDSVRMRMLFDSILAARPDSWINFQENEYHAAPLYLYIRHAGDNSVDHVKIVDGLGPQNDQLGQTQNVPEDQYLVLAPQFSPLGLLSEQSAGVARSVPVSVSERAIPSDAFAIGPFQAEQAASSDTMDPSACGLLDLCETPTMKTQLKALDNKDPATVFIARGISKLGFNAGNALDEYFSAYGQVESVHFPYTFKKCGGNKNRKKHTSQGGVGEGRETRAPGRCFIVMSTADERNDILGKDIEHEVQGVKITLEAFTRPDLSQDSRFHTI
jgi:hypothetical protein